MRRVHDSESYICDLENLRWKISVSLDSFCFLAGYFVFTCSFEDMPRSNCAFFGCETSRNHGLSCLKSLLFAQTTPNIHIDIEKENSRGMASFDIANKRNGTGVKVSIARLLF